MLGSVHLLNSVAKETVHTFLSLPLSSQLPQNIICLNYGESKSKDRCFIFYREKYATKICKHDDFHFIFSFQN